MAEVKNMFLEAAFENQENRAYTENGALSCKSTKSAIVDQFGRSAVFMNRPYELVCEEQEKAWEENKDLAVRLIFYLRMISRKTKINGKFITDKPQFGQGRKDEVYKRLLWLASNHKEDFYNNIWMLPIVGSWKDVWMLMFYDKTLETNAIDNEVMFNLIKCGLNVDCHVDLILKYMPRIKSKSKLKTEWTKTMNKLAQDYCNFIGMKYADYNKMKASGKAHEFQKNVCGNEYDKLKWSTIPGKALSLLVNSKFLKNHNLVENYVEWLNKQPMVKFNGYPYELLAKNRSSFYNLKTFPIEKRVTIDKQFEQLIATARENGGIKGNVWCALDTSGSMTRKYRFMPNNVTPYDICISLGVYFSTLNQGAFHNHVIMFDNVSKVLKIEGTFTEKVNKIIHSNIAWGWTNFMSVIDEIVRIRRENPNIPLEDYPQTLLVISDMQFNSAGNSTNYETAKKQLYAEFPEEFVDDMKFIWWNCSANNNDFPATIDDGGCYFFSGFDGGIITLLLGGEEKKEKEVNKKSMEETVNEALNQEILSLIKVA